MKFLVKATNSGYSKNDSTRRELHATLRKFKATVNNDKPWVLEYDPDDEHYVTWTVELETLDDLLTFAAELGDVIVSCTEEETYIEIYNDYRE